MVREPVRACRQVLLDSRAGKAPLGTTSLRFGTNEEQVRRFARRQRPSMLTSNPPEHTRLRSPTRGPFMPRSMGRLRSRIEDIVDERLDIVAAKGEADMMAEVALELPVTVIGELVGVPPADPPGRRWTGPPRAGERFRQYFSSATGCWPCSATRRRWPASGPRRGW